jgi:hypothetical protein
MVLTFRVVQRSRVHFIGHFDGVLPRRVNGIADLPLAQRNQHFVVKRVFENGFNPIFAHPLSKNVELGCVIWIGWFGKRRIQPRFRNVFAGCRFLISTRKRTAGLSSPLWHRNTSKISALVSCPFKQSSSLSTSRFAQNQQ